jgi:integrase
MRELFQRSPGGVYWCEYHDPKRGRVKRSTKVRDREAARKVRQRYEREAQDPAYLSQDETAISVATAVENLIDSGLLDVAPATVKFYDQKTRHVARLLGHRPITDLRDNVSLVKQYIKVRQDEGAQRPTVYKELVALRQVLHAAREDGVIDFDPRMCFPRFRSGYVPKERWLTPGEFLALLGAFRPWQEGDDPRYHTQGAPWRQLWIVVAVYTGGRDSEVDAIDWEGIDWAGKRLRIPGTKTDGSDRWVPLMPALEAVLARCKQAKGPVVGEWTNVRRDLHAACKRAGIPPCSPNDLRRTYATWLANMGTAENVLIALMGHTSSRMIRKVYAKLQPSLMAREMAKLTGACTTGVPNTLPEEADLAVVSEDSMRKVTETLTNPVLGVGIEPTTRGFSVRVASNRIKQLGRKSRPCTTGVQKAKKGERRL